MLIEKEIIAPGTYFYTDEKTGNPHKLDVSSELNKYWLDQGKQMLASGLSIPVPYEHDFNAHPMTPKDKLLNNAGWVRDYIIKDFDDPVRGRVKDALFGVVDVQDETIAKKLPDTIRWTSPWINSFTDGNGKQWNNVISHLALTLRPRITKQQPFPSIAAALSLAVDTDITNKESLPQEGYCLSRAGRVVQRKSDKKLFPAYPMAFSLFTGVALGEGDIPPKKKGKSGGDSAKKPISQGGKPDPNPTPGESGEGNNTDVSDDTTSQFEEPGAKPGEGKPGESKPGDPTKTGDVDLPPLGSNAGDVSMEEVLCDLLRALGVDCEHSGDEGQFKRNLYMAAMQKVHELTNKGMNNDEVKAGEINKGNPPGAQPNPLVQQEQQPMYMSLEDINKIVDPTTKSIALSMHNHQVKLQAELDESKKVTNSLRDAKLREATDKRTQRAFLLGKVSPKVKADLDAMLALPSMAMSLGDGGNVIDPMDPTLSVLEKTVSTLPLLLTTDSSALSVQPQPSDDNALSEEQENKLADDMARRMGAPAERKAG